jgi:hypothetical protein
MRIVNLHRREYSIPMNELGRLLDSLSSKNDQLWPHHLWPRMEFDKQLSVGAIGGHGPIRYRVKEYEVGKHVRFQFTRPFGFNGYHEYKVICNGNGNTELRQLLVMKINGMALLSWPLIFRPLHDALIEDSLTCAEVRLGLEPQITPWSWWTRSLRWLLSGGKSPAQRFA